MAQVAFTPQVVGFVAAEAAFEAANADGYSVPLNPHTIVLVTNGDVGSHTVTVVSTYVGEGATALPNTDVVIPAGETHVFMIAAADARQAGNVAYLTFDDVTDVTIAVLQA